MIPTSFKAKLPRHLSYPVGAEAISEALAGSPHFEALSVRFWDRPVWRTSDFRRLLLDRLPYKVMAASYMPAMNAGFTTSNDMVRDGWNEEKWEVVVYPVLAEFRHQVNGLLCEKGMPAIAHWLRSSNRAGWVARPQQIELMFSPADGTLVSQVTSGK